jgi:hypothetical protein
MLRLLPLQQLPKEIKEKPKETEEKHDGGLGRLRYRFSYGIYYPITELSGISTNVWERLLHDPNLETDLGGKYQVCIEVLSQIVHTLKKKLISIYREWRSNRPVQTGG